ncbi:diaminopimelate epimerase [Desulfatiferula olefinivorans]
MDLTFTKMHGIGNDFILIDDRSLTLERKHPYPGLAVRLCDRRFGIGADGLLIIRPSDTCDLGFRIINSDGSEAQMCGNGIRCLARFAYESGITGKTEIRVETPAGVIVPRLVFDQTGQITAVTVDMGRPVLDPEAVPFRPSPEGGLTDTLETPYGPVTFTAVSMGNPHAVIVVDDADRSPVTTLGPFLETHERFPEKTNVEFIEIVSSSELKMKVWERGAGITLACGTGACAAVVAAVLNGKTDENVRVRLDGGDLSVTWDRARDHIIMTGPAETVFQGRISL